MESTESLNGLGTPPLPRSAPGSPGREAPISFDEVGCIPQGSNCRPTNILGVFIVQGFPTFLNQDPHLDSFGHALNHLFMNDYNIFTMFATVL